MHASLLDAISHLLAGRFIRARKAAELSLAQEKSLSAAEQKLANAAQIRAIAHLLAAESAQALQDRAAREDHLQQALAQAPVRDAQETREGMLLRAARWALQDRDPEGAMTWLKGLPQGAVRRTLALRIRLKAARLSRHTGEALETARLLAKHRAFSPDAAHSIVRGLAVDLLNDAHDVAQLQRAWESLEPAERLMPELAIHAAQRLAALGGDPHLAREWLLPAWEQQAQLDDLLKVKLVNALEEGLESIDPAWLARIEAAHRENPRDATLQYLAAVACVKRQLWGKAQQLMSQAAIGLRDPALHRNAWRVLALLAQERGDQPAAEQAWKRAASV